MSGIQQQTLVGEVTEERYQRPATLLYCDECEDAILRSERFDHEHGDGSLETFEEYRKKQLDDKVPDRARIETQTYHVEFHYSMVETVTVEASCKSDAKTEAEHHREYNGEYMETVHTDVSSWGSSSPASIEWLEERGYLPEDHDVTPEDLEEVMAENTEEE